MTLDTSRLAAVISPLRRALLAAAKELEGLPNIPDAQIEVLRALPPGVVRSPGELAAVLALQRSTLSNLLAGMEQADLITRQPGADDRRQVEVRASTLALQHLTAFDRAATEILADVTGALGPDDQRLLSDALPALERLRVALQTRPKPLPDHRSKDLRT